MTRFYKLQLKLQISMNTEVHQRYNVIINKLMLKSLHRCKKQMSEDPIIVYVNTPRDVR